jgi:DNA modification methylase
MSDDNKKIEAIEIGAGAYFREDCLDVMRQLIAEGHEECMDSTVTDPPYHLTTGKKGGTGMASVNPNSPAGRAMISTGFMGEAWDGGDVAFRSETWELALRLLKPGGHLLAFGGSRTYHRLAVAIEDAGFEIRDQIMWLYGSGFPKGRRIDKDIFERVLTCQSRAHAQTVVQVSAPFQVVLPGAKTPIALALAATLLGGEKALLMETGRRMVYPL